MNRSEHQDWLARLAAEDRRRRAEAEPGLARGEARLRQAQAEQLAAGRAAARLEALLDDLRGETDGPQGG